MLRFYPQNLVQPLFLNNFSTLMRCQEKIKMEVNVKMFAGYDLVGFKRKVSFHFSKSLDVIGVIYLHSSKDKI